jgi:glutamyl-tRNA reductase
MTPEKPSSLGRDQKIQRVLNGMASKMRRENQRGCYYIEAINEFIAC